MNISPFARRIFLTSSLRLASAYLISIEAALFLLQTSLAQETPPIATANLKVAKDFKAELLYNVPKDTEGSWVAMCVDNKGRLIVSDQYGKLYRIVPPPIGSSAPMQHEAIDLDIGKAHGLLYAFDSLYVMVNEDEKRRGLYRVRDANGDDRF